MKEKFFVSMVTTSSIYLINLVSFYFLFLNLDVELVGIYTFINSFINLGFVSIDLGFTNVYYRYSSKENYEDYFSTYIFIKLILIMLSIALSVVLITLFQLWASPYIFYLFLYLFSMIVLALVRTLIANLKSMKKILISEISFFLYIICKQISIIYLTLNLSNILDPLFYIFVSNFIFELLFLGVLIYISKNILLKITKPKKKIVHNYVKDTKYVSIRALLYICVSNLGNIILDYSLGHETLGYVSLIYQLVFLFETISISLIPIYISQFSEFFKKNDLASIREVTHKVERYSSILFSSIIIIFFLNGYLILSVFLPKYLNSFPILLIMIFNPYLLGVTRPYENQLIPGSKQNTFAFAGILTYILQISLMIILIPEQFFIFNMFGLGIIGYGLALTVPWCLYAIICRYYSKKYFNINSQKHIFFHILLAIIALLISYTLKINILNLIISDQIILLLVSTLIIIAIFFTELFITKQLKKEDVIFILELFKIKMYKESIKEELSI